jgi:hypothetical protein
VKEALLQLQVSEGFGQKAKIDALVINRPTLC